jgi:putative membrane protein
MSDLWLDFTLAAIHHVLVFGLFAILAVEIVYARPGLDGATLKRLGRIDALYGALATLVIIVGFARAIWGLKGWDYYVGNALFWIKVGLFLGVGALSAVPTINFLKWNGRHRADPAYLPPDAEVRANRKWLHMETTLLILIPVVAAALARGLAD